MSLREATADDLLHWADVAADKTIRANPGTTKFTVAAGITPSGVVHIGNFREVITVDLVARALRDRGAEVRFIYSWDDFDVFRKVPADMPGQEMLTQHLRQSIADVPDPYGEHDSYASHNIAAFEGSLPTLGIAPEFIRQSKRYRAGAYAQGIRVALEKAGVIRGILDQFREQPLAKEWLPLAGFLDDLGDELEFEWDGEWTITLHHRATGRRKSVDLRSGGDVKLPWRIDWPMRWAFEQVHFEPGGKDHSSAGGSYDTAKDIVRDVYGWKAPEYVAYDFVRIKGAGGKISSSKGGAITVTDCLEVFEPELLRWIFVSYRPNTEFQISFDADVIKIYEDYDRAVRLAHEAEDGTDKDRKRKTARRILTLSSPSHETCTPGSQPPRVAPFRMVSMVLQAFGGDAQRAIAYLAKSLDIASEADLARLGVRVRCAGMWLDIHAPDEFRFAVRSVAVTRELQEAHRTVLARLVSGLESMPENFTEAEIIPTLKTMLEGTSLAPTDFFPTAYDLLLDRSQGPKLSTLLATLGAARSLSLLRASL